MRLLQSSNSMTKFDVDIDPETELVEEIRTRLQDYNFQTIGYFKKEIFSVTKKDDGGNLLGGGVGVMVLGRLYIDMLWVAEAERRKGLGRAILSKMEDIARERGCTNVWLTTGDFQAPDFYISQGYHMFAELPVQNDSHPFKELFFRKLL